MQQVRVELSPRFGTDLLPLGDARGPPRTAGAALFIPSFILPNVVQSRLDRAIPTSTKLAGSGEMAGAEAVSPDQGSAQLKPGRHPQLVHQLRDPPAHRPHVDAELAGDGAVS